MSESPFVREWSNQQVTKREDYDSSYHTHGTRPLGISLPSRESIRCLESIGTGRYVAKVSRKIISSDFKFQTKFVMCNSDRSSRAFGGQIHGELKMSQLDDKKS